MTEYVDENDQKWNELKLKWSTRSQMKPQIHEKSKSLVNEKQTIAKSLSDLTNSLQKQLERKQATLKEIQSNDLLTDLKEKKFKLDTTVASKKNHIQELRSKQQIIQKEIIRVVKEIKEETEIKTNEMLSVNDQLSHLTTEENELVDKIYHEQKLRASQEKELEELRLERLNIVNKNKDTQKIQEQILQYRNRLDQITSDRSMLELEIRSQMNLLEEEHQKERDIISKMIKQHKN
jgi:chromosome segregation ATPase|tara:strand:- start:1180 stop:1884 length:705 start_codon:yes stop_codon:yes gene_type:complete